MLSPKPKQSFLGSVIFFIAGFVVALVISLLLFMLATEVAWNAEFDIPGWTIFIGGIIGPLVVYFATSSTYQAARFGAIFSFIFWEAIVIMFATGFMQITSL